MATVSSDNSSSSGAAFSRDRLRFRVSALRRAGPRGCTRGSRRPGLYGRRRRAAAPPRSSLTAAGETTAPSTIEQLVDVGGALLQLPRSGPAATRNPRAHVRVDAIAICVGRPRGGPRNTLSARPTSTRLEQQDAASRDAS